MRDQVELPCSLLATVRLPTQQMENINSWDKAPDCALSWMQPRCNWVLTPDSSQIWTGFFFFLLVLTSMALVFTYMTVLPYNWELCGFVPSCRHFYWCCFCNSSKRVLVFVFLFGGVLFTYLFICFLQGCQKLHFVMRCVPVLANGMHLKGMQNLWFAGSGAVIASYILSLTWTSCSIF